MRNHANVISFGNCIPGPPVLLWSTSAIATLQHKTVATMIIGAQSVCSKLDGQLAHESMSMYALDGLVRYNLMWKGRPRAWLLQLPRLEPVGHVAGNYRLQIYAPCKYNKLGEHIFRRRP